MNSMKDISYYPLTRFGKAWGPNSTQSRPRLGQYPLDPLLDRPKREMPLELRFVKNTLRNSNQIVFYLQMVVSIAGYQQDL